MSAVDESAAAPRPFWSVIIPTWQRTQFLAQSLGSVLDQAPPPEEMEIIVQDDFSDTDLRPFIESLGRNRIHACRTTRKRGIFGNVNDAIAQCRGQWVHFLPDDDFVLPGFYATMRDAVRRQGENVGFACCHFTNIQEHDGRTWSPEPFRPAPGILENWIDNLAVANPLNVPAVIFRRSLFDEVGLFREDLPYTADWEFYLRASVRFAWWYQPENLARFRVHGDSQTRKMMASGVAAESIRRTLEIAETYLPAEVRDRCLPQARNFHGLSFLSQAWSAFHAQPQAHAALGIALLKECLRLGGDAPRSDDFFQVLRHPHAMPLREELLDAWRRSSVGIARPVC